MADMIRLGFEWFDDIETSKTWNDYADKTDIGEGAYGKVYRVIEKSSGEYRAIKGHDMDSMRDGYNAVYRELAAMRRLDNRWVVRLYNCFNVEWEFFMVIDYCKNGDMNNLFEKVGAFPLDLVRHYTAELVMALDYLQSQLILHRDIKPENIFLCDGWHLKLGDFGLAWIMTQDKRQKDTYVHMIGTPMYIAPEILLKQEQTFGSDIWALGCIMFEMYNGRWAFDIEPIKTWEERIKAIDHEPYEFGKNDPFLKDLVSRIFILDPTRRIGVNGMDDMKAHVFFDGVDWDNLHKCPLPRLEVEKLQNPDMARNMVANLPRVPTGEVHFLDYEPGQSSLIDQYFERMKISPARREELRRRQDRKTLDLSTPIPPSKQRTWKWPNRKYKD